MYFNYLVEKGLIVAGTAAATALVYQLIKCEPQTDYYNNEIRILTRQNAKCQEHIIERKSCGPECAYEHVCWLISDIHRAKHTIEVCIYLLSYEEITNALITAQKRKVCVRVITTPEKEDTGTMILKLRRAGIAIRTKNSPPSELMHLKFMIIDESLLTMGSLNFTVSGFTGNTEEVIKMRNKDVVMFAVLFFECLWKNYTENDAFNTKMRRY